MRWNNKRLLYNRNVRLFSVQKNVNSLLNLFSVAMTRANGRDEGG